jgi:hypothetical protein
MKNAGKAVNVRAVQPLNHAFMNVNQKLGLTPRLARMATFGKGGAWKAASLTESKLVKPSSTESNQVQPVLESGRAKIKTKGFFKDVLWWWSLYPN